jgi:ubiquinone/menaquinone biosynthesis C-methylase UbiE
MTIQLTMLSLCLLFIGSLWGSDEYRQITRESYDQTADAYRKNTLKLQTDPKADRFLSYLGVGSKILDLGCGPGRDAKFFAERGYQVTGVDISPKMISLAKNSLPEGDFLVSDIESLQLNQSSFDAIWASASLLHVSKKAMPAVLTNLYEALKEGGVFYLSMKKGNGEECTPDHRYGGVEKVWNYVSEDELTHLLTDHGFKILEKNTHEKSTTYQTHPWIAIICTKEGSRRS